MTRYIPSFITRRRILLSFLAHSNTICNHDEFTVSYSKKNHNESVIKNALESFSGWETLGGKGGEGG